MLSPSKITDAKKRTLAILKKEGVVLTDEEQQRIEVYDFGLGDLEHFGIQLFTYVNNDRYCAKELIFFPRQTCPQHKHPPVGADPGKMETFRVKSGKVWAYVEGTPSKTIHAVLPKDSEPFYTVFHEIELAPGQQCTILQGKLHWFQAGDEGAVVIEISSACRDEFDLFTDPRIKR
jgi:D-lyxose ketol-isomerase